MGFSSLGIGSGLDTATMLEQIKAGEQVRLKPYALLQATYQGKVSAWGQISSALSGLQSGGKSLKEDAFTALDVGSNKAFTAKANGEASADTHSVEVVQLATAHKLKSKEYVDADSALGMAGSEDRTLTITSADGKELKIELEDDETSLNQIAKKINQAEGDVSATVQRVDDQYRLVISSKTTGSDGELSVSVEGDPELGKALNTGEDGGMDNMIIPQDAKLKVDGTEFTRSENTISDIITGVTLELKEVSEEGKPEQLTLTRDNSAIKTSLKAFVEQYNALMKTTSAAGRYVDETAAAQGAQNGALMGDSTLRGMVSEIRQVINGFHGDGSEDFQSLAELGITVDAKTGAMTLDESKLDKAIADNPEGIAELFLGHHGSEGIADQLGDIMTHYIGDSELKIDGVIKDATKGLDEQVKLMQGQIDKTQKLIDSTVERYRKQFVALESTMSQLNGMSNQLSALISSM